MANFVHKYVQDLQQEVNVRNDGTLTFEGDNLSNEIQVEITNGGAPASVSGTVVGYAIRANGSTVVMAGTLTGNVASVVLPEACFAYLGMLGVSVQLVTGSVKTTLFKAVYQVEEISTSVQVDPGDVVPDLADVIAMKEAVEAATAAAEAAAEEALGNFAGTFSSSVAYTAGQYVTYTDGKFYRFTADHAAGAWNSAHVVAVTVGGELVGKEAEISELKSAIDQYTANPYTVSIMVGKAEVYGNLFDKSNLSYGYYQPSTGKIVGTSGTTAKYSPTYIPVNAGDVIKFNATRPFICCYDASGNYIECVQAPWAGYTIPVNGKYIRISAFSDYVDGLYVYIDGTSKKEYESDTELYIHNLKTGKPSITVSKVPGYGNYSSLTKALYETRNTKPDVVVIDGSYDIVAEYKALFGNDIFDNMTYQTNMDMFQWGLFISDRKVSFETGVNVTCDLTGYTNDSTRRFSPFNLGRDAEIDGLMCYGVNCYYIIHDDFGEQNDIPFVNKIKNCVLLSDANGPTQNNVIGGGTRKFSTKIVDNCYLYNGETRLTAMRYHNFDVDGAKPIVIIKNTFANHKIKVNCYGTQTTKMTAIINNCQASVIEKGFEGNASTDNVDLYSWCNVETQQ